MTTIIDVFVPGIPRPAGSKRAFAFMAKGKLRATVQDASGDNGKAWRASIVGVVAEHWAEAPLDRPLEMRLGFFLPRPKGHYGKRGLLPRAPVYHTGKPDTLKLARAVEDALTGVVYRDDSLIVDQSAGKRYGDRPGVRIILKEAEPCMTG